jgi:hypothetical protein
MKSLLRHRILTLLAGIITAAIIVFSQLFYFQAANYCQEKASTEQHTKKTDAPETYFSIPSSTISCTPHIEIDQDISFVLETLLDLKSEETSAPAISLPVNKFFQTLFRVIISPNAP